jgi:hypothetical protein
MACRDGVGMTSLTHALIAEANNCTSSNDLVSSIAGQLAAFAVGMTSNPVDAKNLIDNIAVLAGQVINAERKT